MAWFIFIKYHKDFFSLQNCSCLDTCVIGWVQPIDNMLTGGYYLSYILKIHTKIAFVIWETGSELCSYENYMQQALLPNTVESNI